MDIRDLRWLVTVSEHGHVTEAALALGVPQPTLSRGIARVEADLGTRLLERLPTGVRLMPAGELAVTAARELIARYGQMREDIAGLLDPEAGVVRLAFLDSMATSLVPRILRAFREDAPRVRVQLRQEPGHEILDDLISGSADLAITSPRPPGHFEWVPLQRERLVLVVPPGHRLQHRKRVNLDELAHEALITPPLGFGYRSLIDALLRAADVSIDVSFESQDLGTVEGLVAAGLGVAVLPERFAGQSGTIGIPIAAKAARRSIGLAWRADRSLTPPAIRMRDFVRAMSQPNSEAAGRHQ